MRYGTLIKMAGWPMRRGTLIKMAGIVGLLSWALPAGAADAPIPPLEKPGWKLTFHDEFNGPTLNDMYWYPAYRSGRKEYYKRIGHPSRWHDHNAHYVIEDGVVKLRIDAALPARPKKGDRCVSSIQTSDHRFGSTTSDVQVLDKFAQKYGWFEVRCRMPKGSGLHSAFWLLHSNPNAQEYAADGKMQSSIKKAVEIDIFEQLGTIADRGLINFCVHFTKNGGFQYKAGFDLSKEFHVWALEWVEGKLTWYLDGKEIHAFEGETPQEKMFVLLGLYQGIPWAGPIDPKMPYPRDFEVDYVRVYARP